MSGKDHQVEMTMRDYNVYGDSHAEQSVAPPQGYAPVPPTIRNRPLAAEDVNAAHAAAFRTVFLYMLTDAFDLMDTEALWAGYHLDSVFAPLLEQSPHAVPLAVKRELNDGTYSRLMELRERARMMRASVVHDPQVLQAAPEEWADIIMQQVTSCYHLRPIVESGMRGHLVGLLTELGVGSADNPRGSTFLPNDLRLKLLSQS